MLLTEIFNTSTDWYWYDAHDGVSKSAAFEINDNEIEVIFTPESSSDLDKYQIDFVNHTHGTGFSLTGKGSAPAILSIVRQIIVDFVHKYNPKALYFSALEDSRKSLYHRLVPHIAKMLGTDWKAHLPPNKKGNHGKHYNYVLYREESATHKAVDFEDDDIIGQQAGNQTKYKENNAELTSPSVNGVGALRNSRRPPPAH